MADETNNGEYPTSFKEAFLRFRDDWIEHKAEGRAIMTQVIATQEALVDMKARMAHLQELPTIATHIQHMNENMRGTNKWLIMLLAAIVFAIIVALLLFVIRDSNKNLTINRDGFSITETQKHPPN